MLLGEQQQQQLQLGSRPFHLEMQFLFLIFKILLAFHPNDVVLIHYYLYSSVAEL